MSVCRKSPHAFSQLRNIPPWCLFHYAPRGKQLDCFQRVAPMSNAAVNELERV